MLQLAMLKCDAGPDATGDALAETNPCFFGVLHKAQHCGSMLLSLINDILDASRLTAGTFSVVPMAENVAECVSNVADITNLVASGRGLDLTTDVDARAEGTLLLFDAQRVSQILINLVSNGTADRHNCRSAAWPLLGRCLAAAWAAAWPLLGRCRC